MKYTAFFVHAIPSEYHFPLPVLHNDTQIFALCMSLPENAYMIFPHANYSFLHFYNLPSFLHPLFSVFFRKVSCFLSASFGILQYSFLLFLYEKCQFSSHNYHNTFYNTQSLHTVVHIRFPLR